MTEESRYLYMIRTDREPPSLIRLGPMSRMEADMYVWPGVCKDTPSLNDIRVGKATSLIMTKSPKRKRKESACKSRPNTTKWMRKEATAETAGGRYRK